MEENGEEEKGEGEDREAEREEDKKIIQSYFAGITQWS